MFPRAESQNQRKYTGAIYSLLFEPDQNDGAHEVEVGGCLAARWVMMSRGQVGGNDTV